MPIDLDPLAGPQGGDKGAAIAKEWTDQIAEIKSHPQYKRWVQRGEAIEKRYRDERTRADDDKQMRRYNALWSNVEILKPALYGRMPLPIAERRFKDKDPVGRGAAQMLERALRNEIEVCGFDESIQQAVSDYLLPGRGVVWVRYEPEIAEGVSLPVESNADITDSEDEGAENTELEEVEGEEDSQRTPEQEEEVEKLNQTGDRIIRESTPVDFVQWKDFFIFPARARFWSEVIAIGKRVHMSRRQMKSRWGDEIGGAIPLMRDERSKATPSIQIQPNNENKGEVFEIWSRKDKSIFWVAEGYGHLIDRKDDPLQLEYFFPVPKPLFANPTNDTLVPVPDYIQYQDQAIQIDQLTQRIAMLTKACKVIGVYNAGAKDIVRMFTEGVENQLIPVDDWAAFAEKGGVEGNFSLLPVKDFVAILNELMICKEKQIEEMDRLTGITDIMRGTTDARETLGGQRLKSNSAGTRLTRRQAEVARFARDTVRIMADIMAQHFSPKSLIEVSGALYQEGLGPDSMPDLTDLQQMQEAPQEPPQQPPLGLPPPGMAPNGLPGPPQGMQPPAPPPPPGAQGGNVLPFPGGQAPPGAPPPSGMPPSPPQAVNGTVLPPIPPQAQPVLQALRRIAKSIELLRNERLRGFRVDIEVDSTIYPDAAQEKADRTVFIREVTQFLQQAMTMGAAMPESVPLMTKLLQFGVRGYRVGRDLETAIEEFSEQAVAGIQQRQQAAANQPNPEQQKLQIEVAKAQSQLGVQQIRAKADTMKANADIQSTQVQAQSDQQQSAAEVERQRLENEGEQRNAQLDVMQKQMDMQMMLIDKRMEEMKLQMEYLKLQQAQVQASAPQPQPAAPKPAAGAQ